MGHQKVARHNSREECPMFEKGWLQDQMELTTKDIETWPAWMRREASREFFVRGRQPVCDSSEVKVPVEDQGAEPQNSGDPS